MRYRLQILLFAVIFSGLFGCSDSEEKTLKQPEPPRQESSKAEKLEAFEAIKSLPRVVQGYKAFYRHWPQSMQDFDNGEYFFDSDYMAESVTKGFTAYLALTNDPTGYKLWVLPERSSLGYQLSEDGRNLNEINADLLRSEINRNDFKQVQKGQLIFLTAKKLGE